MLSTHASGAAISLRANARLHSGMDVRDIRRRNLAALVTKHGGNKALADATGTDPAYISQLLSPRIKANLGHELARRIESRLQLPAGWMDQPHDVPPQANEKPAAYAVEIATTPAPVRLCPVISWVQAGHWTEMVGEPDTVDEWHPCGVRCGPRTYVLRVQGESMAPRFMPGDLIFVDPDAEPRSGSFVVVRLDDAHQATFKQLIIEGDRRYLRPLNERWPDPIIEIDSNATLCGVVVFQGRPV